MSMPASGFIALPMSRQDIGDHLGMKMETASRAFSVPKERGAVELPTAEKYRLLGKTRNWQPDGYVQWHDRPTKPR
jgi:hypothetical protein